MEQVINYPRTGTPTLTPPPVNRSLNGDSRRQQLASFLRSRRESLSPEAIGIPRTLRRRVRGLRREEVAEAAGISTAWYTWIEQARDLNLSIATLDSIGHALRLNAEERQHLFQLAGQNAPLPASQQDDLVMTPLREMLRGMEPNPAYALDPKWDIVAWNQGAETIFGDLGRMPREERNYMKLIFTAPAFRELFVNWEEVARCSLAHFRSDSAGDVDDPDWLRMVADLKKRSSAFYDWWPQHNVAWPYNWRKELRLPTGNKFYNSFDMELSRPIRLRIVTYIQAQ
jgi:transcriptional regulator with XRE-family HTH domain